MRACRGAGYFAPNSVSDRIKHKGQNATETLRFTFCLLVGIVVSK